MSISTINCKECNVQPARQVEDSMVFHVCPKCGKKSTGHHVISDDYAYTHAAGSWNSLNSAWHARELA